MAKQVDKLLGKKYGMLEVIEFAYIKNHNAYWKCRCDCDKHTEVIVSAHSLKRGNTKSCGCLKFKDRPKLKVPKQDLRGTRIGYLEPLFYVGDSKWHCKCHNCGKEVNISTTHLTGKIKYKSCGCLKYEEHESYNFKDLTGQYFGYLEVLYKVNTENRDKRKGIVWHCRCHNCGNEIDVYSSRLLSKVRPKSHCGCISSNKGKISPNRKDRTGQVFGKLTVLEFSHTGDNGRAYWKCQCSCDNKTIITVSGHDLSQGHVKSCGCLKKELGKEKLIDLTNQRFGKLVVNSFYKTENDRRYWLCTCDCGSNNVIVDGYKLRMGYTKSCGCLDVGHSGSKEEHEIYNFILAQFPELNVEQHDRKALDGKEMDIYIPELKVGIEYNGSAFHASSNGVYDDKDKYYHRDKFLLAKSKGIHLITVFDKEYEENKELVLVRIKDILGGNKQFFIPQHNIEYTDNNYDYGEWIKDCGYEEILQEEPISFKYKSFVVYTCGRTVWKKKKE